MRRLMALTRPSPRRPRGAADLAARSSPARTPATPPGGLTHLNLTHNGIGDAGVLALAAALDGSRKPQPAGYYDLAAKARDDGDARAQLASGAAPTRPVRARRLRARRARKPPPAKERRRRRGEEAAAARGARTEAGGLRGAGAGAGCAGGAARAAAPSPTKLTSANCIASRPPPPR